MMVIRDRTIQRISGLQKANNKGSATSRKYTGKGLGDGDHRMCINLMGPFGKQSRLQ